MSSTGRASSTASHAAAASRKQPRRSDGAELSGGTSSSPDIAAIGSETKRIKLVHAVTTAAATVPVSLPSPLVVEESKSPPPPPPPQQQRAISAATADLRAILKHAAMERAARARTNSSPSVSTPGPMESSPSPTAAAAAASPAAFTSSLSPANAVHAPSRLHLNVGSPHGSISTPILHTAGMASPSPLHPAAPSPTDELAGFAVAGSPTNFRTPSSSSNIPPSLPTSGSSTQSFVPPIVHGGVQCPLCAHNFPPSVIEAHAATCTGELVDDATIVSMTSLPPTPSAAFMSVAPTPTAALPSFSIRCTIPPKPLPFFPRHHDTLKILTWNCWFDDLCMRQRMEAIGSVIVKEAPHVVALQEVTEASLAMILRSEWSQQYYISDRSDAPYFTLLCTKFAPERTIMRRLPFKSVMARDLLLANIEVPTSEGRRRLTIATSHLESEHRRKEARRQQLEVALKLMRQSKQATPTAIYCGDMNLVGTEASDIVQQYGWSDAWLAMHPGRGADKAGVTMDTQANRMLAAQSRNQSSTKAPYQARLDRVWLRTGTGEKQLTTNAILTFSNVAGAAKSPSPRTLPAAAVSASPPATTSPLPPSLTSASSTVKRASPPPPTAAPASASSPEWRLASIERVGLCSLDLRQPHLYATTKDYKSLEAASSPTSAFTSSAMPSGDVSSVGSSRVLRGFGTLVDGPPSLASPIFPSDHFGLLVTLELVRRPNTSAAEPDSEPIAVATATV